MNIHPPHCKTPHVLVVAGKTGSTRRRVGAGITKRGYQEEPEEKQRDLPKSFYVVPFWVVYYNPLPKIHNRPKKELHRSPWVECKGFQVNVLRVQTTTLGSF